MTLAGIYIFSLLVLASRLPPFCCILILFYIYCFKHSKKFEMQHSGKIGFWVTNKLQINMSVQFMPAQFISPIICYLSSQVQLNINEVSMEFH